MRLGNRQFKPSIPGTIATVVVLVGLLNLGAWQLRRADEKRALLAQYERGAATTQQLNASSVTAFTALQAVIAQGRFDGDHQTLLDNMPSVRHVDGAGQASGGTAGYHVLTPLHLDDGSIVLVDRGWIPLGASREVLPAIPVGSEHRSVRGRINELPRPGIRMGQAVASASWPQVLNYPTMDDLRALYGARLLPRIVLLDAAEPDGFEREWSTHYAFGDFGPEKHVAYAVQWFGLAFTLVIIYFVTALKRIDRKEVE